MKLRSWRFLKNQSSRNISLEYFAIVCLSGISAFTADAVAGTPAKNWRVQYNENFKYSQQDKRKTDFNTWFWREDSVGLHQFEYIDEKKCTTEAPCVKLTAPKQPEATNYINSEMYNNSCVGPGAVEPSIPYFKMLSENPLSEALHNYIYKHCNKPYPYREDRATEGQPQYATDSWNRTTIPRYYGNKYAFTKFDNEAPWQAVRDIAFNSPYLANEDRALRLTATIRAEGQGGGSRGWGFWNTTLDPEFLQLAWFMEYSSQKTNAPEKITSKVYLQTIKTQSYKVSEKSGVNERFFDFSICSTPLPDSISIYDWHKYQIVWSAHSVSYHIDGKLIARHAGKDAIPDKGMAFHNWVDNRNYFGENYVSAANYPLFADKSNYINELSIETAPGEGFIYPDDSDAEAQSETKCDSGSLRKSTLLEDGIKNQDRVPREVLKWISGTNAPR